MTKKREDYNDVLDQLHTSGAGYDILRYICIPDILGKEANTIMYIMGKNLVRKFKIETMYDLTHFFIKAGWGNLTLEKEKRREMVFILTGDSISSRDKFGLPEEYRLEAGFLAEAIQTIKQIPCECIEEWNKKKKTVQFRVMFSK